MPSCPIKHNNPECNRAGCAWWQKETEVCAVSDMATELQFVACLRNVLERLAEKNIFSEADLDAEIAPLEKDN